MKASQSSTQSPLSLMMSLSLAQHYADMGLAAYNNFADAFRRAQEGQGMTHADTIAAISAAMLLAFSAELFIKVLNFKCFGSYSRGHDLERLIDHLPENVRSGIEQGYNRLVAENRNLLAIDFGSVRKDEPKPQSEIPPPQHQFKEAIKLAAPLYERLRYLYEEFSTEAHTKVDFRWLIFLLDALRQESAHYKGNATVTWKET